MQTPKLVAVELPNSRFVVQLPRRGEELEEAGDELFTMYRFPKQQWKNIRTTNVIERLNGEFRRRVRRRARSRARTPHWCCSSA